jgi:adenylate kinase
MNTLSRIVFLGPPGSGKGTQASVLSKELRIPHISTGDVFRSILKGTSALGAKIRSYVTSGGLVPDEIVFKVVKTVLKKQRFFLDGYPRTVPQAEMLDEFLGTKYAVQKVLYFKVADREVIRRLTSRRTCGTCGAVYNVLTHKPKKKGICDACGGTLVVRKDDEPATVKHRLKVYHRETKPLIAYYRSQKKLAVIDATQPVATVRRVIHGILSGA